MAVLIKKREMSILMTLRCSVVCVLSTAAMVLTVTIHRVVDDVAATHTSSACVYTATCERKEVD